MKIFNRQLHSALVAAIMTSPTLIAANPTDAFELDKNLGKDLELTVWASTPMLHSPVAMDVDPQGRMWVVEDLLKSEKASKGVRARILVMEDTDHDGKADKATPFGPTFSSIPYGIAVFDNRIVVSAAPDLTVFTDVDRNGLFDPAIDKQEVLLTGFQGKGHDHSLHAVLGSPSGEWHFSQGNMGADLKMPDGREFHATSYYSRNHKSKGLRSWDGHLYVGGFGLRMQPDGTKAAITFHNARNTHDLFITSFGDHLHTDNDDPAHSRASWVMPYANYGYASLEDGSRSWEEAAKSWDESAALDKNGMPARTRVNKGHWREHSPGTTPPGAMWGAGAPTGNVFIEGDELGAQFRGTYVFCETVQKALFAYRPKHVDAQIEMTDKIDLLKLKASNARDWPQAFLPSDVVAGLDGSLYLSDWNSFANRSNKGTPHGAIYRIVRKDKIAAKPPTIDLGTTQGQLDALKSPAVNVRWVAAENLKKTDGIFPKLKAFHDTTANPYYKARVIWIMAALADPAAKRFVEAQLPNTEPQQRILAFRSLLAATPNSVIHYAKQLANDPSPAVRREVATSLRDLPYSDTKSLLQAIINGYDGKNRYYLEAIGIAVAGKETEVYEDLVRPRVEKAPYADWDAAATNLAWRLRSPQALDDLQKVIQRQPPDVATLRRLIMSFSLAYNTKEKAANIHRMQELIATPAFSAIDYQATLKETLERDLVERPAEVLATSYAFPAAYAAETKLDAVEEIVALTGNVEHGRVKAGVCMMCHRIGNAGVPFGPNLTNWAQSRDLHSVILNIVDPAAEIAHGFEKSVVVSNKTHRVEGIMTGYSRHAGSVKVKTVAGQTVNVAFRKSGAQIEYLKKHSWMPSAAKMGLSNQDVRDVAEYLKSL